MRIIALSAHTDDAELGCGGALAALAAAGHTITYIAFSAAEDSVPKGYPPDVLRQEVVAATGQLGIASTNVRVFDYAVRTFPSRRQDILDELIRLRTELRPELVFLPAASDTHQDHQTLAQEGFRAFKYVNMLGYELPWNMRDSRIDTFVSLAESDLDAKSRALAQYSSQATRPYMRDFAVNLARVRGLQAGVELAEAYELVRWFIEPRSITA